MKILYVERKAAQDKSHRINKPQKPTRMSALLDYTVSIMNSKLFCLLLSVCLSALYHAFPDGRLQFVDLKNE
jgi:hypothetical protein